RATARGWLVFTETPEALTRSLPDAHPISGCRCSRAGAAGSARSSGGTRETCSGSSRARPSWAGSSTGSRASCSAASSSRPSWAASPSSTRSACPSRRSSPACRSRPPRSSPWCSSRGTCSRRWPPRRSRSASCAPTRPPARPAAQRAAPARRPDACESVRVPVAPHVLAHAADPAARDRVALRTPERSRTYAALGADVRAGSTHLGATGTRPGDLVAVSLPDPLDCLTAVLAVDHLGATPLVCDPSWPRAHRAEVLRTLAPRTFVEVPLPRGTGPAAGFPAPGRAPEPGDLAWAGFSSGSTGRPRAVVRTRASWAGSFDDVTRLVDLTPADTVLVPGPLASSLYCFAAVHALAVGAGVYLPRTPAATTTALARCDVVHLVPQVLDDVLAAVAAGAPSRLRHAVVGGASLPAGARARAAALGVDVLAYYGAV